MRSLAALVVAACVLSGCASATIEPGHRGLLFDPQMGLKHEVLQPGVHRVPASGHVDDFDITYATHVESLDGMTSEGLPVHLRVAVISRPIVAELYQLDTEIGPSWYDEVIGPEARSAVRGVIAATSIVQVAKPEKLEDTIEAELRRRTAGKHVEIASVVIEAVQVPKAVEDAMRERVRLEMRAAAAKAQAEADAAAAKARAEADAAKRKAELELGAAKGDLATACADSARGDAATPLVERLAKLKTGGEHVTLELLDTSRDTATGSVRIRARATLRSPLRGDVAMTEVSCRESGDGAEARCMAGLERDLASWLDDAAR